MRLILHSSSFYIFGAVVLIAIALYLLVGALSQDDTTLIIAKVERGDVTEIVSVSGVVEAENSAELAFPATGLVTEIFVDEGDIVKRGDVLATLASGQLVAQRLEALASLKKAQADRDELIAGPTSESRSVTTQKVVTAETNLAQVIAEESEKVKNAKRSLFSGGLETKTDDPSEGATPPTVSGAYNCDTSGSYAISVYQSGSASGYSYRVSGLESGTYPAFVDNQGSFGVCGLSLQFDSASAYSGSTWKIDVPNTRSSVYSTNLNTYELAVSQQEKAVKAAENALELAKSEAIESTANPRSEALQRADAAVLQAQARISAIDAQISDRSIVAPFDGMVTDVSILPGETATAEPVITMLAEGSFELTAQIPEIDITKLREGQRAEVVFDAQQSETIEGVITFISPLAYKIDGVAYFEAIVSFGEPPVWLRSGLNADIEIIVQEVTDVLRVPKRFVQTSDNKSTILVYRGNEVIERDIERGFVGNDGFIEVKGLEEGVEIVAP